MELLLRIEEIINQTEGFEPSAPQWEEYFYLHNTVFSQNKSSNRACSGCRRDVRVRLTEYYHTTVKPELERLRADIDNATQTNNPE